MARLTGVLRSLAWLKWRGARPGGGHLGWAHYCHENGDLPAAEAQAQTALAKTSDLRQPLGLIAANRLLGELAMQRGNHDIARIHRRESLALAEACAAPYKIVLTQLALAGFHVATWNVRSHGIFSLPPAPSGCG